MKLRLAANPATWLDIAQARQALVTYLLARRHGAQLLLRLDDADPGRVRPEHLQSIPHDLAWLGLDWDQTVQQSARLPLYQAAADRLRAAGRLYPCFESEEELNAKRDQRQRRGLSPIYDRAMLKLTPEQRARADAGGKRPYWRFRLSGADAEWGDMALGRQRVKRAAVSDPILVRADGAPLQTFAAAVDDQDLGITHVVREDGQLTNTAIQQDILAALGARPGAVRYAHLPALGLPKPAKGARAPTVRGLRNDGIEPEALAAYLAGLGALSAPAPATPAALARAHDLSQIGKAAPRFDPSELLALNRRHLRTLPFEAVQARLPPGAAQPFWHAVRGHLDLLTEARAWWDIVAGDFVPPPMEAEAPFLRQAVEGLPAEPWDAATWPAWTEAVGRATGREGQCLDLPLRLALTGEEQGPDLSDLLPLIGRPRAVIRLTRAMR